MACRAVTTIIGVRSAMADAFTFTAKSLILVEFSHISLGYARYIRHPYLSGEMLGDLPTFRMKYRSS